MEKKTLISQENRNPSGAFSYDASRSKSNQIEIPTINLPKGGGAIKGIDEKFTVNAVNGTASFSIPLPFSKARGVTPSLNISYNSGSGNGIFGLGWSLSLVSIKRKTDNCLPQYLDHVESDVFLFSEAEDLVPEFKKKSDGSFELDPHGEYIVNEKDSSDDKFIIRYYKPRIEALFARIERWMEKTTSEIKWRVITRENVTTLFGWTTKSRIKDPNDPLKIFEWLPEFVFDDKGNVTQYFYKSDDIKGVDNSLSHNRNRLKNGKITYTNCYLERIMYGNKTPYTKFGDPFLPVSDYVFSTLFDYGEYEKDPPYSKIRDWDFRTDAFSDYKAGFEIRTTRLCKRVLFFHHFTETNEYDGLVKSLNFVYDISSEENFTFLKTIISWGYIKKLDGSYSSKKLPAMEFEYQKHEWNSEIKSINADDLIYASAGRDKHQYQFTDLFNEGLAGILSEQANGWYYKRNLSSGEFEKARLITSKPSVAGGEQLLLVDLDADGGKQLVSYDGEAKGYFELIYDKEWLAFKAFQNFPNFNFKGGNTRMLDLNGDGKPEAVITEENVITWFQSEGREGFKNSYKTIKPFDEEAGPAVAFADRTHSIFLADMSGDGMTDIVRIKNGEICYWPNLGYGKFGGKVTFDHPPVFDYPDNFNPSNIRLADIDGSGTTDVIYLGNHKFTCWKNLGGNSFSTKPFEIDTFTEIHSQAKASVVDLLGNGISCIVWSSPLSKDAHAPLKYIDLINSKKPHILIKYANNLGKEVSLEYTPSTKFYVDDKSAGKPWVTKLPFPVHCVSKTITEDKITGHKLTSSYKYHHGYYDHPEREFRGFGMVEQIDAETFEHWKKSGASNITNAELHQDPVVTMQWTHTGAFLHNNKILTQFAHEYWYEEMTRQGFPVTHHEKQLDDAIVIAARGIPQKVIDKLTAEERRQAWRACKGIAIRSEVFAYDAVKSGNRKKELTPYSVATHNCVIELLQPKGKNRFAVFIVKEREAIHYGYERNAEDPRIAHTLNIKLDEYGNVLESASVVYPRLNVDTSLPTDIQQEQFKSVVTYSLNKYTNDIIEDDSYRLRLASEVQNFELKGVQKAEKFYSPSDFKDILDVASEVHYHQIDINPPPGITQKRLIEQARTLYLRNDLTGALPLHKLESLALSFENYQLAYTPELRYHIFGSKVDDYLMSEAKFVHGDGDNNWWAPSGIIHIKNETETSIDARSRFYTPLAYTDPYGATTKVKYYGPYFLFIQETEDALGNKTRVDQFNFRTLYPRRMKDINANLTEAITDELGLVKAIVVSGKGNEADDLFGLSEFTDPAEEELIAIFFNAPDSVQLTIAGKNLLQHATTRCGYDFDIYKKTGKPVVVASIAREEHFKTNNDSPIQISLEYSSGLGQVAMKKIQVGPGIARKVVVNNDNTVTVTEVNTNELNPIQLRWIGTGRSVLNNKGSVVKQYEPYFSVAHQFEAVNELVESGVTPLLYYDALGRLVRTEMPDGTFSEVEVDSWRQSTYDANDTVLESSWYKNRTNRLIDAKLIQEGKDPLNEKIAADKAALHANTPQVLHQDTLGRTVLTVQHNKNLTSSEDEYYFTKTTLDSEGNLRKVTDARGNMLMQYKYDMLGNMVYQSCMDAGQRWLLVNILGNPLRTWDERNHEFQYLYDILRRPIQTRILGGDRSSPLNNVVDKIVYGESLLAANRSNEEALQAKNLLGKTFQHYDTGGLIDTPEYDFKGSPLATTRMLYKHYKDVANWVDDKLVDDLEDDAFTFMTETDALGRITRQIAPDESIIIPSYNEAGLLNGESIQHEGNARLTVYIKGVDYNEKGQCSKIVYGNNVLTKLHYDKETFRLKRLETIRQNNDVLQDLYYSYDPVGNITSIEDKVIDVNFFNHQKIEGVSEYTYDALYRVTEATGRENNVALNCTNQDNWNDSAFIQDMNAGSPMAMRNYNQHYTYDPVGNILRMRHTAAGNCWTRDYAYESINNRLRSTTIGSRIYNYPHHLKHGFITELPHLEEIEWNFKEELVKSVRQRRTDGGTPETTYYQYDGQGLRIRKITELEADTGSSPALKDERIYVSNYELYKSHVGSTKGLERTSLSLTNEGRRFVMIDAEVTHGSSFKKTTGGTSPRHTIRYQLHNHLGSSALELDHLSQVISYEEYHPYGTTSFQAKNSAIAAVAKRYRYTGMERDEESGLEYHRARYYLPWLGRWLSCDALYKDNNMVSQGSAADNDKGYSTDEKSNKCNDNNNPQAFGLPYQYPHEDYSLEKSNGQWPKPQRQPNSMSSDEHSLPGNEDLSDIKNLNLYVYAALDPIVYQDPTGDAAILQAWWKAWDKSTDTGEQVGLAILFIFAWLAHVVVNLFLLIVSITILNPFGLFGALDFSWGGIQSIIGLALGIVAILFGATATPHSGMGAQVELPEYMKFYQGYGVSLGPVTFGHHGFTKWDHEAGHTWQSRLLGPLYLFVVGIPSAAGAAWTEKWADKWAM